MYLSPDDLTLAQQANARPTLAPGWAPTPLALVEHTHRDVRAVIVSRP